LIHFICVHTKNTYESNLVYWPVTLNAGAAWIPGRLPAGNLLFKGPLQEMQLWALVLLCIALSLFFTITLNAFAQVKLSITQTLVSISNNPRTLLKADFNHDVRPDLVTWSNEPKFSVLLNDKTRHFAEITTTTPKPGLAVADFNKDGFNDVAVCSPTTTSTYPSRTLSIYRGSSNGNFMLAGKGRP
jgi:hypothetical protein